MYSFLHSERVPFDLCSACAPKAAHLECKLAGYEHQPSDADMLWSGANNRGTHSLTKRVSRVFSLPQRTTAHARFGIDLRSRRSPRNALQLTGETGAEDALSVQGLKSAFELEKRGKQAEGAIFFCFVWKETASD